MIFKAGELSLVEYGCNEVLACARTEHMSPHLISVRMTTNEDPEMGQGAGEMKVIAYLIDLMTIRICDLVTNQTLATISHDTRIDWLELNPKQIYQKLNCSANGAAMKSMLATCPSKIILPSRRNTQNICLTAADDTLPSDSARLNAQSLKDWLIP